MAPRQQPASTLADAVRSYNEGVRWERFEIAAVHVPPKQRSQFVDDADERAKDVKITEYDVVKVEQKGEREAEVQIKMSWYKDSEGTCTRPRRCRPGRSTARAG